MSYSNDDVEELHKNIDGILKNAQKYNYKITNLEDLQNRLRKKTEFKGIDLQSECEGGKLLGDLLLKYATENGNSRVKDFLLKNGFKLPEQEQVAAANEEEEEQNIPDVEEDRSEPSNKNEDDQLSTSYNKIKKIVASNPNITAEEFCNELKKEKIDIKITNQDGWNLLYYAVRSEGPGIIDDRIIFLKIVELLTNLNIGIHFKDTASRTVLGTAAINKQVDVIKILLDSEKFDEEEKLNALRLAIIQGNVQEAQSFLGYVNDESRKAALDLAMNIKQEEITQLILNFITPETPNVEENRAKPCSSNENVGNKPIATASPILTKKTNSTTAPNSGNGGSKPVSPVNTGTPAMSSVNDKSSNFTNAQFSRPNEKETKHKESKENFYASLRNDVVGVVITGLFIAAAVMIPSVAGAVVCGIIAVLVAVCTGLHVKNSTLPSYREMEENKVEPISQGALAP